MALGDISTVFVVSNEAERTIQGVLECVLGDCGDPMMSVGVFRGDHVPVLNVDTATHKFCHWYQSPAAIEMWLSFYEDLPDSYPWGQQIPWKPGQYFPTKAVARQWYTQEHFIVSSMATDDAILHIDAVLASHDLQRMPEPGLFD